MKKVYLHIGFHKTGTTSFQYFLNDHRAELLKLGYSFYEGMFLSENHVELFLASMRPGRDSFAADRFSAQIDETLFNKASRRIRALYDKNEADKIIFSSEGLGLLRYDDEIERLKNLLDLDAFEVHVIAAVREKTQFLESYRRQLMKGKGRRPSNNPDSSYYVEQDAWIAKFEERIKLWKSHFGNDRVQVLDYDQEISETGDIVPRLLCSIGLPRNMYNAGSVPRMNQTSTFLKARIFARRIKDMVLKAGS